LQRHTIDDEFGGWFSQEPKDYSLRRLCGPFDSWRSLVDLNDPQIVEFQACYTRRKSLAADWCYLDVSGKICRLKLLGIRVVADGCQWQRNPLICICPFAQE